MDPISSAAIGMVGKLIAQVVPGASESVKKQYDEWRTPARIRALGRKLAKFELVKTLVNPEKAQKISDFYLPPMFAFKGGKKFRVEKMDDFGCEEHPLIEGIAGQGKSIFMRQLFIEELKLGDRLPLLIELRRISSTTSLLDLIVRQLDDLGFPSASEIWKFLAQSGRAILLLDGFDELKEDLRAQFLGDVESFETRYPDLRLAITTRPEAVAARGASFLRSVRLQPIDNAERGKIIAKICDKATSAGLVEGLSKNRSLSQMVDTPLFVTLLCVAYRAEQRIPETTHEFYDLVFNTLLYRHDALKLGFDRPRKSGLGNHLFSKAFEGFSFLTEKDQALRMSESKANEYIVESLENEGLDIGLCDKYFSDLVQITCLLVKDGTEYQFLHRSIQDYFAARYIARLEPQAAVKIYMRIRTQPVRIRQFGQVLRFLGEIDAYKYTKYFVLPSLGVLFNDDLSCHDAPENLECNAELYGRWIGMGSIGVFNTKGELSGFAHRSADSNFQESLPLQLGFFFDLSAAAFNALLSLMAQKKYKAMITSLDSEPGLPNIGSGGDADIKLSLKTIFTAVGADGLKILVDSVNASVGLKNLREMHQKSLALVNRTEKLARDLEL